MNNLVFIVLFAGLLACNGQEKQIAIEIGFGAQSYGQGGALTNNFNHFDGVVRFNLNKGFGLGIYTGYSDMLFDNIEGEPVKFGYTRLDFEGVMDTFRVLGLKNNFFTMLLHGGLGISSISVKEKMALGKFMINNNYNKLYPNVSNGVTGLFQINGSMAIKMDWTSTILLGQKQLKNASDVTNGSINTALNNFTIGLVLYPSEDRDKRNRIKIASTGGQDVIDNVDKTLDFTEYLRKVSGVSVKGNGAAAEISIRGVSTMRAIETDIDNPTDAFQNAEPVFVINGQVFGGTYSGLYGILDVNTIKSVRILKGPETAFYGARGGNGVIEITTY